MRKYFFWITGVLCGIGLVACTHIKNYKAEESLATRKVSFDLGWKFLRDSLNGPEQAGFNDSAWRRVDLPHDWSIENLPENKSDSAIGPFSPKSIGATSTGYVVGGTAWYRKHFLTEKQDSGKVFIIHFDGVYMECEIWVNGKLVGSHNYGYTPFYFAIGTYLNKPGSDNVLAVKVKNIGRNSRWYSGSGIYRHVWLSKTTPAAIVPWGIAVNSNKISRAKATVEIKIHLTRELVQEERIKILTTIFNKNGQIVNQAETNTEPGMEILEQGIEIIKPDLWSVDTPDLYKAQVDLVKVNRIIDRETVNFGIRSIKFSARKGFELNGNTIKLKGACIHHDNGLLGAAAYDRAEERRIEILKNNGFNAIRTSHNPPSEQFLDACDRLGMLVIDEAFDMWEIPKNPNDYSRFFKQNSNRDIESMVLRDRNHPSIIIWSIGNEIPERGDSSGVRIAKELKGNILALDSSRPVTAAICSFWDHPGRTWDQTAPAFQNLDIAGYNYQWVEYTPDHSKFPDRIMMGTESVPKEAYENWKQVAKCSWVIGDFVWTGMDYLGETGIAHVSYSGIKADYQLKPWPWYDSWCGDIDICGFKKPQSYYRDVVWGRSKIEIAVQPLLAKGVVENVSFWGWPDEQSSWNWPGNEGKAMKIRVYTSGDKVQLLLNDRKVGESILSDSSRLTAIFEVPYEPGVLKVLAYRDNKLIDSKTLETTGRVASIRLTADRNVIKSDRNDLAYVIIEALDNKGNLVPNSDLLVHADIKGQGELLASGNSRPDDMHSFRSPSFRLYQGRGLLIVRASGNAGNIDVLVTGHGLNGAITKIKTE